MIFVTIITKILNYDCIQDNVMAIHSLVFVSLRIAIALSCLLILIHFFSCWLEMFMFGSTKNRGLSVFLWAPPPKNMFGCVFCSPFSNTRSKNVSLRKENENKFLAFFNLEKWVQCTFSNYKMENSMHVLSHSKWEKWFFFKRTKCQTEYPCFLFSKHVF